VHHYEALHARLGGLRGARVEMDGRGMTHDFVVAHSAEAAEETARLLEGLWREDGATSSDDDDDDDRDGGASTSTATASSDKKSDGGAAHRRNKKK
jgi:hypothetical protein